MPQYFEIGSQLRDLLRGILGAEGPDGGRPYLQWGPRIDYEKLPDLYAPQEIKPFFPTPGGIDNLHLTSTDTFYVPGRGEITVEFKGYMRVARANPTSDDWNTNEVFVNMIDLRLRGESREIGPITVRLNPEFVSAGQVFPAGGEAEGPTPEPCRIAAAAIFELPMMGFTPSTERRGGLFNKEPILLMNDGIRALPPVEDPNGYAYLYKLPLYNRENPDGRPVAYINSLKYTVGNYVTREEAERFRNM